MTIRTVLSALPETRRSDAELKCKVVGGNSCAFKIVNNGWVKKVSLDISRAVHSYAPPMLGCLISRPYSLTSQRQGIFHWHYGQRKAKRDRVKQHCCSPYVEARQAAIAHLTILRHLPLLSVPFTDESATGRMLCPGAGRSGVDNREQDFRILGVEFGSTEATTSILAWQLGALDSLNQLQRGNW